MAKFTMECPRCKKPLQVSTGLFAKNKVTCPQCKKEIDVALEKMVEESCPRCGGKVVYDISKPSSAICPTCHTNIKSGQQEEITCPSCQMHLNVDKNAKTCVCPQCKSTIDVQARLAQKESGKTAQVIKWDGENGVFIYRHPMENFKLGSQLIVKESQKAIFFRNGQALDVFGPGRYTLETQNLPLIEEVLKYPTDADLTFSSQVYFVRTDGVMPVKWALPYTPLRNPGMNFYVQVGACGSADIKVMEGNENVRKFLAQVIGTATNGSDVMTGTSEKYDAAYLENKFRDYITTRLGSFLTDIISSSNINILDLAPKRAQVSDMLIKEYNEMLEEYGLTIPPKHFMVTDVKIQPSPELDAWMRQESDKVLKVREEEVLKAEAEARHGRVLVEEQTEVQRKILRTQGESEERRIYAQADADITRITAQGDADASIITGRADADVTRIAAQGDADATVISSKGNAEASVITGRADADVTRLTAQGNADATIITGKANAETSILSSRAEAEGIRLTGQASAEAYTAQAIAEAEEMRAKGYTYAQETSRQLGLEALQNGLPGTGSGGSNSSSGIGSALGDMVGLGVGMSALGGVVNMTKDIMSPIMSQISDIGKQPTDTVVPPSNLVSAWNCACGKSCITSKFCPECGTPKPATSEAGSWNCTCGQTGITSNFCPNCGARRPASSSTWNCTNCGQKDISSNFCPNCGSKKGV